MHRCLLVLLLGLPTFAGDIPIKPLMMGNWADPTITKLGDTYYLSSNNDGYVPSVMVFTSKDLRLWEPLSYACPREGQGPATDIIAHDDKLYIYGGGGKKAWATKAEAPFKSWSARINMEPLQPHGIDAGHVVDDEGNRYLYTNQGKMLKISPDGLKALTAPEKVYDGWPIPDHIDIECICLESPKLFKRGDYFYMVSAAGGTAGPATSHMAIVARAKQAQGPWENSPHNPMIWTQDATEDWWSKGHATLIEGPDRHWYAIYHGYPRGQRTLGRCTLISPVTWTADAWPVVADDWPSGWEDPIAVNWPLSDEFEGSKLGIQWQSLGHFQPERYALSQGILEITALRDDPGQSYPLCINPQHRHYEVETELVLDGEVSAGLILFYNTRAFVSVGLSSDGTLAKHLCMTPGDLRTHRRNRLPFSGKRIRLRLKNDHQDSSAYYAAPGDPWIKMESSEDISGLQHNVFGGFVSVRPGIYVTGKGKARFSYFRYRGFGH